MRFLHTSDWHLGRSFHHVGLLPAQARFVDHLVEVVRAERVEAVLVSGDVYDRALPAPETVTLLSEAVTRLIDAGAQVVLSSGNHDSAIRLGFAADLLSRAGLHIRSTVSSVGQPVLVGDVAVHPLPYLEPASAADTLGASERTHPAVLRAAMDRVRATARVHPGPSLVMAHAFVTGGATSASERDISVGGVGAVHPDVFAGVDYVALGHLHGAQRISDTVRYSGSPVAMSFSEAAHTKGSWLVELDAASLRCEHVEAPVDRPLAVLRGELEQLLADPSLSRAQASFCRVTLTDPVRPLAAMDRLRRRFPHTLALDFDPDGGPVPVGGYASRARTRGSDEAAGSLEVCCQFLEHVRAGRLASAPERDLLRAAVEGARVTQARKHDEGGLGPAAAGAA